MSPKRIIGHISGPLDCSRHEANIYTQSGYYKKISPFLYKNETK